jgi:hypothetical protein
MSLKRAVIAFSSAIPPKEYSLNGVPRSGLLLGGGRIWRLRYLMLNWAYDQSLLSSN